MPEINLLPWREELREERKRQFLSVLVSVVVLAAIIGFLWMTVRNAAVDSQLAVNNELNQGIAELEQKVKQIDQLRTDIADMLDRFTVIKRLQTDRPEIVKLFDQFARSIPEGTYITRLEASGNSLLLEGKAESNPRVASLMRNMVNDTEKFTEADLTSVIADRELGNQGSSFEMTAVIVNENDQANDQQAEQ